MTILMFYANVIPYWLFANKYWSLGYQFEELIKPFDYDDRPQWHKYFIGVSTVCFITFPLASSIIFILDFSSFEAALIDKLMVVAQTLNTCTYFIILAVMIASIRRITIIT